MLNATNTTTVPLVDNEFVSCPPGMVATGRTNDEITCVQLDIEPQKPVDHRFPTLPKIGAIVKRDPKGVPTSAAAHPSDSNWFGTPIQGLVLIKDEIHVWHYGTTCNRPPSGFEPSRLVRDIGINQVSDAPRTCDSHEYIAFIQCQQANDCAAGINLFCVTAEEYCEVQGEEHIVRGKTDGSEDGSPSASVPVCPAGMAAVGFGCTNADPAGKAPCATFEIVCKEINFDPHFVPPAPPSPGDEGGSSKTIIISLSVGLPLLIVGAIVCLFCIPDTKDGAETGALLGVARTDYDIIKSDYDSLRRRNRVILNVN